MNPAPNQTRTPNQTNQNQIRLVGTTQQTPIRPSNVNQGQVRNLNPNFQGVRQPPIRAGNAQTQLRGMIPANRTPNQQFRQQNPNAAQVGIEMITFLVKICHFMITLIYNA